LRYLLHKEDRRAGHEKHPDGHEGGKDDVDPGQHLDAIAAIKSTIVHKPVSGASN
jgi:hypothetical protein